MERKKSLLNVFVSILCKIVLLITTLLVKRSLIKNLGNEFNGLNSLYLSLVGILAISELGIGTAITFSMYEPICNKDDRKVAALYNLFRKVYKIIGCIILVTGIAIMPFLPTFAKDYTMDVNIYLTFGIMLVSVVLEYTISAKTSLINAHKNNYITTIFTTIRQVIQHSLQIVTLIVLKSFEVYLICRILSVLIEYFITTIYVKNNYSHLLFTDQKLDNDSKKEIVKNTKAMFMHKIGSVLSSTIDSVIISSFVGIAMLGKYSNYIAIISSMESFLVLFFVPLTSTIGHLCVKKDIKEEKKYFNLFYTFNMILSIVFFLGYYAVIDSLIQIIFGNDLFLPKSVTIAIVLNYFTFFIGKSVILFRDATGTFYNDRYKPLIEGVLNIILSLLLVKNFGVFGVVFATIITNLVVRNIIEPFVLYKHVFKEKPTKYYIKNYSYVGIFCLLLIVMNFFMIELDNVWLQLIVNGFISVCISAVPIIFIFIFNKNFRNKTVSLAKYILFRKKQSKE